MTRETNHRSRLFCRHTADRSILLHRISCLLTAVLLGNAYTAVVCDRRVQQRNNLGLGAIFGDKYVRLCVRVRRSARPMTRIQLPYISILTRRVIYANAPSSTSFSLLVAKKTRDATDSCTTGDQHREPEQKPSNKITTERTTGRIDWKNIYSVYHREANKRDMEAPLLCVAEGGASFLTYVLRRSSARRL